VGSGTAAAADAVSEGGEGGVGTYRRRRCLTAGWGWG
jgi:hypothetical protein